MPEYSVLIASSDPKIRDLAKSAVLEEGHGPILCGDGQEALESARNIKDASLRLLVLDAFLPKTDGFEVVRILSENPETKDIPSLMLLNSKNQAPASHKTNLRFNADDYLQKPFESAEIKAKIHSQTKHYRSHGAPHPVTGLPGHPQLEGHVAARLSRGEVFDLVSFDINFFKPFNDHYGTAKGNEAIRMVANMIKGDAVFAHIDGDDFFILAPAGKGDAVRQDLRQKFQSEVQKFYSKEEVQKGFIFQKDRQQKDQIFPLMTLSTAVLEISKEKFAHYGEIVTETYELLRQSKIGSRDV